MFQDSDFNSDGNLIFPDIPKYKAGSDSDSRKEYYRVNDYCENLIKFSQYQNREQLWQNYQRLSLIQQKVLSLLVSGKNINQVATECHIERSTIYRWLQLDIFIECLKLWQKNLLFEADFKIKKVVEKGLEKLEFILDNPDKFEGKDYLKAIELSLSLMGKNS
jgi:hypothetical protein